MRSTMRRALLILSTTAVLVLGGGSTASAASTFTAEELALELVSTTREKHVFTLTGSKVECAVSEFEGNTEGGIANEKAHTQVQAVHPVYKECSAFGFKGAVVNTEGCGFQLNAPTVAGTGMGNVGLEFCVPEREIEKEVKKHGIVITVNNAFAFCEVMIPSQTIEAAVSYENTGTGGVNVAITATGIEADVISSKLACPLTVGTHTGPLKNGGIYTGKTELTALGGWEYTP
jgi:hypothetical protein